MRTTRAFQKVERAWYVVDVADQPLGRAAARIAILLRGKHKPQYTPHADTGDFVIAVNASRVVLTGRKSSRELLRWHTGTLGHLRERPLGTVLAQKPDFLLRKAVKGMLPRGPLGRAMLRKLKVYPGPEHPHQAQRPRGLDLSGRFLVTREVSNG